MIKHAARFRRIPVAPLKVGVSGHRGKLANDRLSVRTSFDRPKGQVRGWLILQITLYYLWHR
ncbi:hypothetical protein [Nonomuraea sp. NPDC050783]|uniref:hypothetical protein n=1 Tax=Nonomuraea sp. NPDC050783 TaxID=3154634 RepID=UPI00346548A0